MNLKIDRGHIHVKIGERSAIIRGEMFPGQNGKMGSTIYLDQIKYWEPKEAKQPNRQSTYLSSGVRPGPECLSISDSADSTCSRLSARLNRRASRRFS